MKDDYPYHRTRDIVRKNIVEHELKIIKDDDGVSAPVFPMSQRQLLLVRDRHVAPDAQEWVTRYQLERDSALYGNGQKVRTSWQM